MKPFGPEFVGEALRRIYDAHIPGRIEWMFDDGFVWVLLGRQDGANLPRLWLDDILGGATTVAQSDVATEAQDRSHLLRRDWLKRGRARTVEEAVRALASAIADAHPHGEFARWWRELWPGATVPG